MIREEGKRWFQSKTINTNLLIAVVANIIIFLQQPPATNVIEMLDPKTKGIVIGVINVILAINVVLRLLTKEPIVQKDAVR